MGCSLNTSMGKELMGMIDFSKYHFFYNADAHYKAEQLYDHNFFTILLSGTAESFNAMCWGLAETSLQGELYRRYQGLDKGEYLTEEKVRTMLTVNEVPIALDILMRAISEGMDAETGEDEEIDEVLMELQKKTTNASPKPSISTSLLD